MKLIYQGKEVGITNPEADTAIELFGDSITASQNKIIACRCNNEIRSLDYKFEEGDNVELIDLTDDDGMKVYI